MFGSGSMSVWLEHLNLHAGTVFVLESTCKQIVVLGIGFLKVMAGGASGYINCCYLQHSLPCSLTDM